MCVKLALHSTKSQQRTLSALKDLVSVAAKVLQGAFPLTEPTIVGTDVSCKIFFEKKKKKPRIVSPAVCSKNYSVYKVLFMIFRQFYAYCPAFFFLLALLERKADYFLLKLQQFLIELFYHYLNPWHWTKKILQALVFKIINAFLGTLIMGIID